MDGVVVEFPHAQDSLGQIRALLGDIARPGAQGDDRVNLNVLSCVVQGRIDTVKRNMNVAYDGALHARGKAGADPAAASRVRRARMR